MNIYRFFVRLFSRFFKKKTPFIYIALGDSAVEGIGASTSERSFAHIISRALRKYKGEVVFFNLGKAGATVKDVLHKQVKKAIKLQPDLITLSVGANDILHRTKSSQFEKDLQKLLNTLANKTNAEIVMNNIPDLSVTPAVPRYLKVISGFMVRKLNNVIQKAAGVYDVLLVDLYFHSKIYADFPETISDDNFHPSDLGYAIWANTIITHIRHIISGQGNAANIKFLQ